MTQTWDGYKGLKDNSPSGPAIHIVIIQQPKALQVLLWLVLTISRSPSAYSKDFTDYLATFLVDILIYDHLLTHYYNMFYFLFHYNIMFKNFIEIWYSHKLNISQISYFMIFYQRTHLCNQYPD